VNVLRRLFDTNPERSNNMATSAGGSYDYIRDDESLLDNDLMDADADGKFSLSFSLESFLSQTIFRYPLRPVMLSLALICD
jgi:hypothetical protein